jgi:myo-inositol-1-phosphate synthase
LPGFYPCGPAGAGSRFVWRSGQKGRSQRYQEWLSFYFKSPQTAPGFRPEHDIFKQLTVLQNALRKLMGEELVNPEGLTYAEEEITA